MKTRLGWIAVSVVLCCGTLAHGRVNWSRYLARPDDWFRSDDGRQVMENILSWQDEHGGWRRNRYRRKAFCRQPRSAAGIV
jgi:hypothetical protein